MHQIQKQCDYFPSLQKEIYANLNRSSLTIYKRPLVKFWQSFVVNHNFCPVLISPFQCWFPQLAQRQCVAFMLIAFSIKLTLYANYHFKPTWKSCKYTVGDYWNRFSGRVLSLREMTLITGVSATRWHIKSPVLCSWYQQSYPGVAWALVEDNYMRRPCTFLYHEKKQFFFSNRDQGGAGQAI